MQTVIIQKGGKLLKGYSVKKIRIENNQVKSVVCEVNGNAGFRTASLIGGIDIPTALAEYMSRSLCQHKFHF